MVQLARAVALGGALAGAARPAQAQAPALSLDAARVGARRISPDLRAMREAVSAAAARERQAGAFSNPTLVYGREQAAAAGQTSSQGIVALEQRVEIGGQRGQRRQAAGLRREAAEARLAAAELQLDFEVTRAYALAVAADRRAALAAEAAGAFGQALTVSEQRLAAGDISGYAHRRLRLEAARYATLNAEAALTRHAARLSLATLLAGTADSIDRADWVLTDSLVPPAFAVAADSLRPLALRARADLRAADLERQAAAVEARLTARERVPTPSVVAGFKRERGTGGSDLSGFTAGISFPLSLFDRRGGAIDAAGAEVARRAAETDALRRRVARDVAEAYAALQTVEQQLALLTPQLGAEARAALEAARVAYAEGEITLVEWLDAVRAYREAEASYETLRAEAVIQRAALERAVGVPRLTSSPAGRN